ncbi:MAG TPA: methyltransferase domain-containing protein [Planctomycetota bacterium]|nr:methyltransferase domain-containing protein [Planctomycetota bacterium]
MIAPTESPRRELANDCEDVTCLYQWKAGAFLATLPTTREQCRGRRVVDLSCGRGTLGLSAGAEGAARVLFADASAVAIDFLTRTIAQNNLTERAGAALHTWSEALPDGPWEVILGGDILYRPEWFPALLDTIAASLSSDGCALLSDPRSTLEDGLPALANARGLAWNSERIEQFTVVTITRQ